MKTAEFLLSVLLGALIVVAIWFVSSHYSTRARLLNEARPLEVRFLQGEKLSREDAEKLAGIHERLEGMR